MSSERAQDFQALETGIGYRFKNPGLLNDALTHSSTGALRNYERLEFLGDRVLGLCVAQMLYVGFPQEKEGDLAKRLAALVQGSFIAKIALEIDLGRHIVLSASERESGGALNENILADVFEALIGALYLDGGLEPCATLIEKLWRNRLNDMPSPPEHPKTGLQEWAQGMGLPLPVYTITQQSGPDHAPLFTISVEVEGYEPAHATGRSRQEAEKAAARAFLDLHLGKRA